MFEKDVIAWTLNEDGDNVQEVHVLRDGGTWRGPWLPRWKWNRNQNAMRKPYPKTLYRSMAEIAALTVKQERLGI